MIINRIAPLSGMKTMAFIVANYPSGSVCTCTKGNIGWRATATSGRVAFPIQELGTWRVTATDGTHTDYKDVTATTEGASYSVTLSYRVPDGYQEVEYLQSSGTQFINTGFVFPSDLSRRIEIKFMLLGNRTHSVGGTYNDAIGGASMFGFPGYVDGNGLYEILSSGAYVLSNASVGSAMTVVFNNASHYVTENGTAVLSLISGAYNCSLPFYLFGVNFNGSLLFGGSTRIYSFKYYNSSTNALLADYVPCYRKSDNVAGFWDVVSETFKTNSGSGSFTVGPTV